MQRNSFFQYTPLSVPLSLHTPCHWLFGALGVWWVGGRRGCRVEGAGIHSNMRTDITIAPLGELQMLLLEGKLVGSYLHANMRNDKKKTMHASRLCAFTLCFLHLFSNSPVASASSLRNLTLFSCHMSLKNHLAERPGFVSGSCSSRRIFDWKCLFAHDCEENSCDV